MIKLLLILLILASCTKPLEMTKKRGLYQFKNFTFEVKDVNNIEWRVGRKKDKTVSQGFIIQIGIPKISRESAEKLETEFGINSWIYKVSKISKGRNRTIGYIDFQIANTFGNSERFSAKVLYHAASISDSFRRFHCPAFKHRALLKNISLENFPLKRRELYSRKGKRIKGKVERPSFSPIAFSGGRSLKAKFIVSAALYDSKEKRVYGSFVPALNIIDIRNETRVSLPSCIGIKEEVNPLPESRPPNFQDLTIK